MKAKIKPFVAKLLGHDVFFEQIEATPDKVMFSLQLPPKASVRRKFEKAFSINVFPLPTLPRCFPPVVKHEDFQLTCSSPPLTMSGYWKMRLQFNRFVFWGGKRPGAGRPPTGKVRLVAQVKPETLAEITRRAAGRRLGLAVDEVIQSLPSV